MNVVDGLGGCGPIEISHSVLKLALNIPVPETAQYTATAFNALPLRVGSRIETALILDLP